MNQESEGREIRGGKETNCVANFLSRSFGHSFLHSASPAPVRDVLPKLGDPFVVLEPRGGGGGGGKRDFENSGVGGFKSIEGGGGGLLGGSGGGGGAGGRERL